MAAGGNDEQRAGEPAPPGVDGRWWLAVIVSAFVLVLVAAGFRIGWGPALERLAGVYDMGRPFADLHLFPAAQATLAAGGDPYVSNPADPWQRLYNYPRVWLAFMRFPVDRVPVVGLALIAAWLAALAAWCGRLTPRQGILLGLFVCSPPVVLGLERGNGDLIVFMAVVAALALLRRDRVAGGWAALAGAFVLKLYPAAAFPVLLRSGAPRAAPWLMAAAALVAAWLLGRREEITLTLRNTETNLMTAYGAPVAVLVANELRAMTTGAGYPEAAVGRAVLAAKVMAGLMIAAIACLGWRRSPAAIVVRPGRECDGFIAGAGIYLATFAVSASFNYRLMFLLLAVPWLARNVAAADRRLSGVGVVALAVMAGLMFLNLFAAPVPVVIRELCAWGLAFLLAWEYGGVLRRLVPAPTAEAIRTGGKKPDRA
jgi:hypothetical protein